MLHSRLLRYLDEVARCGSIRKAAEKLNISASSINRQILQLEEELGTPLFVRLHRRLQLTAAGETVTAHIRETLRDYGRLKVHLEQLRGSQSGSVNITAMHGIAGGILLPVIDQFRRNHPNVSIYVKAAVVEGVVQSLLSGEADIGLAYRMPPHPSLIVTAHFTTQIGAVVAPDHPFAKRTTIRLADCLDHTVVMADESLTIHQLVRNAFLSHKIDFRPSYVSNSVELMKGMARTQQAVTFLSRIDVAQDVAEGALVFVPFHDGAQLTNQLALARRDMARRSPAATVLEEYIRDALHKRNG